MFSKIFLFDIDGTLLLSGKAGYRALTRTFEELFGVARGFDDIPVAQYVTPALTSVHVPIHEMGTRAVEAVLSDAASQTTTLPTRLIVRESCGA